MSVDVEIHISEGLVWGLIVFLVEGWFLLLVRLFSRLFSFDWG